MSTLVEKIVKYISGNVLFVILIKYKLYFWSDAKTFSPEN